jgi:hypothetical protein
VTSLRFHVDAPHSEFRIRLLIKIKKDFKKDKKVTDLIIAEKFTNFD